MRILMATGGSLHSETALWLGGQIAAGGDKAPTVLTVIAEEGERAQAGRVLARAQAILRQAVPAVETKIRVGQPYVEILQEAEEGGYDLLVIGERQLHRFRTRMRGSIVDRVTRQLPCPILIAKGKIEPLQRILICDSGRQPPSLVAELAGGALIKLLRGARLVTVLHVMPPISPGPGISGLDMRADAGELMAAHTQEGELLEKDLALLASQQVRAAARVRHGPVVEEILAESQRGDYDLVVIGAHREAGWQRLLLDDITHEVVDLIDRPVLILR